MSRIKSIRIVRLTLSENTMLPSNEGREGYGVEVTMPNGSIRYNECSFCSRNFDKQFADIEKEAKRLSKTFKVPYFNAV